MLTALLMLLAADQVTPTSTMASSLPNRFLMNGRLVREVRLIRPCVTLIATVTQTVEIDWHVSEPRFRTTDHNRKTIVDGHVFTTSDQRAADRIEMAASRLAVSCHGDPASTLPSTPATGPIRRTAAEGSR